MAYPQVLADFMQEVSRSTPYFYADPKEVPRTKEFHQLKTFVYFHLSVFEEIYQTTRRSTWIAKQFESEGWDEYIFVKMRHPLMKEVFNREATHSIQASFGVHRTESCSVSRAGRPKCLLVRAGPTLRSTATRYAWLRQPFARARLNSNEASLSRSRLSHCPNGHHFCAKCPPGASAPRVTQQCRGP